MARKCISGQTHYCSTIYNAMTKPPSILIGNKWEYESFNTENKIDSNYPVTNQIQSN